MHKVKHVVYEMSKVGQFTLCGPSLIFEPKGVSILCTVHLNISSLLFSKLATAKYRLLT